MSEERADGAGPGAPAPTEGDRSTGDRDPEERRLELLAVRTEEGRLGRGEKLADKVGFAVREADLVVASVGKYNVVVDAGACRIQHACRDFRGQFREGRLCKHVAAVLLATELEIALPVLESLAAPDSDWSLEVIKAFGSR